MEDIRVWINWHNWLIISVLWVLLCVLVVYLEIMPRLIGLLGSYDRLGSNHRTIIEMDDWEMQNKLLASQINLLEQHVHTLYISIPTNDQMSVILDYLQECTEQDGLTLSQIKSEVPVNNGSHWEQPLFITVSGGFHDVAIFIDRIERSSYLIKMASLNIFRESTLGEALRAELELRAVVVER